MLNSQKAWPSPEIRGTVGLPWSPLSDQMQSPSVNNLYSTLDNGGSNRRGQILNSDYNNINQNILEHRSVNGNILRSSGSKAAPQVSSPLSKAMENERIRKCHTPAETGVLRSYTNTPNGKVAWPNEKQLGWQPKFGSTPTANDKAQSNLNQWSNNSNNWANGGTDYHQWNGSAVAVPSQSWQQPQQQQPQHSAPINYRNSDRGPLLFAPQSQMHRIVSTRM